MSIIWFLLIGLAAGWLAGQLVKGRGFGMVENLIIGVIGALIGGYVFGALGVNVGGLLGELIAATVGCSYFSISSSSFGGRRQQILGTKFRPKSIFEGRDDPCYRFGNLLSSEGALGVTEQHVEGQAPMTGRYLGALVLVDQTEVFKRWTAGGPYRVLEIGVRNLDAGDNGEVAGDSWLPAELMVCR